jgi:hypothetical protein
MPGDPQECRQHAQDYLRLAQEATSDPAREDYTALADTWTQLANIFESDNALLETLNDGVGSKSFCSNLCELSGSWPRSGHSFAASAPFLSGL